MLVFGHVTALTPTRARTTHVFIEIGWWKWYGGSGWRPSTRCCFPSLCLWRYSIALLAILIAEANKHPFRDAHSFWLTFIRIGHSCSRGRRPSSVVDVARWHFLTFAISFSFQASWFMPRLGNEANGVRPPWISKVFHRKSNTTHTQRERVAHSTERCRYSGNAEIDRTIKKLRWYVCRYHNL